MRGKQSAGAISTIRSVSTPPRAVKSSVRLGERKAARHCLDPRETLLFLCLKSPASCHLAPVSSLFSHTCSSSRSHCPGHVSKKKGGVGGGKREVGKHTPTPISRKKREKKSGLFLDPLGPRSWRPGEVRGVGFLLLCSETPTPGGKVAELGRESNAGVERKGQWRGERGRQSRLAQTRGSRRRGGKPRRLATAGARRLPPAFLSVPGAPPPVPVPGCSGRAASSDLARPRATSAQGSEGEAPLRTWRVDREEESRRHSSGASWSHGRPPPS